MVDILLRGRYWQYLNFRDYPLHNQTQQVRNSIVTELAEHTGKGDDIAFGRIARTYMPNGGESLAQPQVGYELRQPLNSGANTIHYLQYFEQLRQTYLLKNSTQGELAGFTSSIKSWCVNLMAAAISNSFMTLACCSTSVSMGSKA